MAAHTRFAEYETESEGAEEMVAEFGEEGADEAGEDAAGGDTPVSHAVSKATNGKLKAGGESDEGDEGDEGGDADEGISLESEAGEEAAESEFEAAEGWDESDLVEAAQEEAEAEATVDPWFAEATPAEQQEFFAFLAPLIAPLVKAAIPALAGAAAQNLPKLAGSILKRLGGRRRGRGRESGVEAEVDEAALEAMVQQMEVIIGKDDRVQITKTTAVPWKRICHLQIEAANGSKFLGSGALVAPRTVITAGHCVFMHTQGGWARSITVTPGRNGRSAPFGQCKAIGLRSVRGWTVLRKREYDYGAIILPRGCLKMTPPSAFGFANLSDAALKAKKLNIAGYPGDKPAGTMWFHGRKIKSVTSRTITYDIDTMGGQSGSPTWMLVDGKRTMVGIHTNGSPSGNSATRIGPTVLANLKRWRQEGA